MNAIILAAGFGSRLMPLTKEQPKCMVQYQDKKIIDYEIQALKSAGINEIAVVGGYLNEVLKTYLSKYNIRDFFINLKYNKTNMVYTLFCAKDFILKCIKDKQDLIVSYADIVYFEDSVQKLMHAKEKFAIVVDKSWRELWDKRFANPLEDAETLKIEQDYIVELGKKASTYEEIQAQYTGLFKFSYSFLEEVIDVYENLDKHKDYDGKDFENMYMTSFLQILIDKFHNAKAIYINGNWCEIDFISDLTIHI
ncbi:phosphocholine cytidylyltransferase family protein [Campylobacter bilis]|uniref:phosphocholine cytidylyltransferase family protein n=1 Tax=Campylobacter bilis TaxID=2691918 RepID=UPI00130DD982|nr:phosphocholine cytidylyltransferase family protein [Campylobacter bilis]MPV64265.1 NTP transferase domain-containing protein [Campylobacter hepaticus]MBM0637771.1 NTP transferase domain-containing protein [Campylobacter bilis]MCC8278497.1 phosphocholine cytidylyltransferase family protein [Campylobacter bilis]MCC8300000.1 phosphocholine cytidylyltransferase family protein [Campylobacter bilis]MCC8301406.1 phosphocholine cytidylyltransferase family protein [Campylobacter bilis]